MTNDALKSTVSEEDDRLGETFHALANSHRVMILRILRERGLTCRDPQSCTLTEDCCDVGELQREFGIPKATFSYHLKELRRAGLIVMQRRGRHVYCFANAKRMQDAGNWLLSQDHTREHPNHEGPRNPEHT